jgi:plastocyanin
LGATAVLGALASASLAAAADQSVSIQGFAFDPTTVTVDVGDKVTWTNLDTTIHTVSAKDGSFDSGNLAPSQSFTETFTSAGSFPYRCDIHSSMNGTVVVRGATPTTAAPTTTPVTTAPPTTAGAATTVGRTTTTTAPATTTTVAPTTSTSTSTTEIEAALDDEDDGGGFPWAIVLVALLLVGGGVAAWLWWRRRGMPGPA